MHTDNKSNSNNTVYSTTLRFNILRPLFRFIHYILPAICKLTFRTFAARYIFSGKPYHVINVGTKKLCISCENTPGVDYIFYNNPNIKRYNKNNNLPALENLIKPGSIIIDVGASHGDEVVDYANLVMPDGIVYALEPDPTDFEALKVTIKINKLDNVYAFNVAASDTNGMISLTSDGGVRSTTQNSIFKSKTTSQQVDCLTLDYFWKNTLDKSRVDFIKIDTDGAEIDIVNGAQELLKSNPSIVMLVEFLPTIMYSNMNGEKVLNWYENQGFALQKISISASPLESSDFEEYVNRVNDHKYGICHDVLLTRKKDLEN